MQNIYDARQKVKIVFLLVSMLLVGIFLYISNQLVADLSVEERNKMEIWAEATREVASNDTDMDMGLILKIIQSNTSIPVIVADEQDSIRQILNLKIPEKSPDIYLRKKLEEFKSGSNKIEIYIDEHTRQYLYYDDYGGLDHEKNEHWFSRRWFYGKSTHGSIFKHAKTFYRCTIYPCI